MARTYNSGWRDWFNTNSANIGNAFVVEGLTELSQKLDRLQAKNPEMEKKIQGIIGKALNIAKKNVSDAIRSKIESDPREAYKAVRRTVYRRILGGNLNILRRKRAKYQAYNYTPTRTLKSGQRGGNRRLRNERTMRMESYFGEDRGFILRFLNSGTGARKMGHINSDPHRSKVRRGSQGGDVNKYGSLGNVNTGNRGRITAGHFFGEFAKGEMETVAEMIEREVDRLIQEEFGKG